MRPPPLLEGEEGVGGGAGGVDRERRRLPPGADERGPPGVAVAEGEDGDAVEEDAGRGQVGSARPGEDEDGPDGGDALRVQQVADLGGGVAGLGEFPGAGTRR